jgi:hypothetical protein
VLNLDLVVLVVAMLIQQPLVEMQLQTLVVVVVVRLITLATLMVVMAHLAS